MANLSILENINKTQINELFYDTLFTVKSMFYLLKPSETYFKNVEDVPPLVDKASNIFFGFIVIEFLILALFKKRRTRLNDGVTSLSAGLINRIPIFFIRSVQFTTYVWVFQNYRICELAWDKWYTYLITLLLVDLGYYIIHRGAHEVNLLWAAHQVHHSSEDYNLSTALRQPILQDVAVWVIYLPLALLIPPSIFAVHSHMNLLYQFWIHTELIKSLGPLEYIFNTPKHHRIHHGRNGYCIDKNYAGVLIIWDRIFGTYESGENQEEVAYGLVHNVETFNPLYIQYFHYQHMWNEFWKRKTFNEKLCVLFKGPGWYPGSPRLGDTNFPKVEFPVKKYDQKYSTFISLYIIVHFGILLHVFSQFLLMCDNLSTVYLSCLVFVVIYSLTSFGTILDNKNYAYLVETIRCLFWILFDAYTQHVYDKKVFYESIFFSIDYLYLAFKCINILSCAVFFLLTVHNYTNKSQVSAKKSQ